jgi:hypothetical protein
MLTMQNWNSQIVFPQDNYILRCTDASFGPSKSSGNPMITLSFEIVAPESINVAGTDYNVAGIKTLDYYLTTQSKDGEGNVNVEKTENLKTRLDDATTKFGIPAVTNPENPSIEEFKGKFIWACVNSKTSERRKAPTTEQLARGEKQGDILMNPVTGKPQTQSFPQIVKIFGVAKSEQLPKGAAARPF